MPARQYTARRLHLGCCACLLLLVSYRPLALDAYSNANRDARLTDVQTVYLRLLQYRYCPRLTVRSTRIVCVTSRRTSMGETWT